MNKLFTFGDSFTLNKTHEEDEYSTLYRQLDDFHWPEIIASKLNLELVNFGYGSLSNDRIIDSILENHHLITENDVVIIGKTFYHRFDIPNNQNRNLPLYQRFTTVTPSAYDLLIQLGFSKEEAEHIIYFLNLVNDQSFVDRTNFRYEFIEKFLYSKKISNCIFWEVTDLWTSFENIKTATDNKINDNHWSFKGHRDFANHLMVNFINDKKLI
jgi:hypothetical protein